MELFKRTLDEKFEGLKEIEQSGFLTEGCYIRITNKFYYLTTILGLLVDEDIRQRGKFIRKFANPIEVINHYYATVGTEAHFRLHVPEAVYDNKDEITHWSRSENSDSVDFAHLYDKLFMYCRLYYLDLLGMNKDEYLFVEPAIVLKADSISSNSKRFKQILGDLTD